VCVVQQPFYRGAGEYLEGQAPAISFPRTLSITMLPLKSRTLEMAQIGRGLDAELDSPLVGPLPSFFS